MELLRAKHPTIHFNVTQVDKERDKRKGHRQLWKVHFDGKDEVLCCKTRYNITLVDQAGGGTVLLQFAPHLDIDSDRALLFFKVGERERDSLLECIETSLGALTLHPRTAMEKCAVWSQDRAWTRSLTRCDAAALEMVKMTTDWVETYSRGLPQRFLALRVGGTIEHSNH